MKTKFIHLVILSSTLFLSSCANISNHDTPHSDRISSAEEFYSEKKDVRAPASLHACYDFIAGFFPTEKQIIAPAIAPTIISEHMATTPIRYPKGFENIPGKHIQYGFESEYLHEETDAFLVNYMPAPSLYTDSKETWLALTPEKRLEWIDAHEDTIFPYRKKGYMVKISTDPDLIEALPDSFVYDTGNFEIVLDPMDSAEMMIKKIKIINQHFGVGSMQVMISNPLDTNLLSTHAYRKELKAETIGYYNFINDFDTINKLGAGHERYLINPDVQTIKSFNHPWLGPMTKLKHDRLESLVNDIINQKNFSDDKLRKISTNVTSHKFIGGLSFRPDVAYTQGRIASEVRDCHQNLKCIENRIIRETYFLMKGKEIFAQFSKLKPFDSIKSFKALPYNVQEMLKQAFPAYDISDYSLTETEIYRNFSYPLRDWSKHVEILNLPELKILIKNAQDKYIQILVKITNELHSHKINQTEAQIRIMGALGAFSKNSGLLDAINTQFNHLIDPNEIKYFDQLKLTMWIRTIWNIA